MAASLRTTTAIRGTSLRRQRSRIHCNKRDDFKSLNPADALMRSLGGKSSPISIQTPSFLELGKQQGRVPNKTNLVFGGTTSEARWREIDKKVKTHLIPKNGVFG